MNILITGSGGMLGIALCDVLQKGSYNITGLDLTEQSNAYKRQASFINCDITDYPKIINIIEGARPDIIIHTAAFTDVDACESELDKAQAVNALGTRYVAEAASQSNATLIYISTDFVFDGEKNSPYREDDIPNPINVYGRTKLDGERFVIDIKKRDFFIVRSSWMFGIGGKNFVDTILKKGRIEKEIRVVSDQFGSPTYTQDLAKAIMNILNLYKTKKDIYGIYHITNSDDCSWYRFAQKTLELGNIYGIDLIPITSEELDRPAERPVMSILDNTRFIRLVGEPLRNWDKALEEYMLNKDV